MLRSDDLADVFWMTRQVDVLILGGGVTGSATAFSLASRSDFSGSIVVVERDPTYENAPSAKATGGFRQQFSTPENIGMGLYGAEFIKNVDQHLGVDGEPTGIIFREQGYLLLAMPEAMPAMQQGHDIQVAHGADIVFKSKDDLAAEFPWVSTEEIEGAFFGQSNEGWIDPYMLLQAYRKKARSLGVEFVKDEALHINASNGRATGATLAGLGEVHAGTVVNAAGARGARALARSVGVDLPLESRLRFTFVFECKEDFSRAPLTVLPNGCAWRPEGGRYLTNLAPPPERDLETFDYEIDHNWFEDVIWPSLARWIPAFEAIKVSSAYACHYDFNLLDENLIIDQLGEVENCYFAAGFSGHGLQQSPAVGRALAELICDGKFTALDLTRFGFARVAAGEGIHEINCW